MTTTFDSFTILFASRPVCLLLLLLMVCAAGGRNYRFDWTTVSTSTSECYSNAALLGCSSSLSSPMSLPIYGNNLNQFTLQLILSVNQRCPSPWMGTTMGTFSMKEVAISLRRQEEIAWVFCQHKPFKGSVHEQKQQNRRITWSV